MPFEISPTFRPTETRQYQHFADAMLRGCAVTRPARGVVYSEALSNWVPFMKPKACAIGALLIGLGRDPGSFGEDIRRMNAIYCIRYGWPIPVDNDHGYYTREEIAARIAAL